MDTSSKNNNPVVVILLIVLIGGGGYFLFTKSSNQSANSPSTNSITSFFTPESDAQMKCKSSTQKAFNNWSEKLSKQFYDSLVAGDETDPFTRIGSTVDHRDNFNTDVNLCFMEYVFSWKLKRVSSGNEGQVDIKFVQALFSDTNDPTTNDPTTAGNTPLATLVTVTAASGSQLVRLCSVMVPGHYDDPTQKPVKELLSPTQCTSESAFDSLVLERFGIR